MMMRCGLCDQRTVLQRGPCDNDDEILVMRVMMALAAAECQAMLAHA